MFPSVSTKPTSVFRTAFDIIDTDHDEKISRDDLRRFYVGLSSGGVDVDDDVIGFMMSVADFNKDGFVEYEEFERVLDVNGKTRGSNKEVLEDVFKLIDKDGDGKLSRDDLKSYMQWAGFDVSDNDIETMMKLGGGDDKGGVCFDDFVSLFSNF
ncbi:calcium-binding protein CP1 [Manihot esculenta]|uniref:EF-hand domain-containing protein n=1 Tax=Manihot esculenta TaxID=3983 RepID=A0A2C9WAV8_MANES|nr:calcium-binding protein CP1 [Manihot esculenta]OAY56147.1 hypothetical protein MANES_03G205900v8 [Manihot esculenta]